MPALLCRRPAFSIAAAIIAEAAAGFVPGGGGWWGLWAAARKKKKTRGGVLGQHAEFPAHAFLTSAPLMALLAGLAIFLPRGGLSRFQPWSATALPPTRSNSRRENVEKIPESVVPGPPRRSASRDP